MNPVHTSTEPPIFELKGSVLTAMVLHLHEIRADVLLPALEKKLGQAKSFFSNAPVVIDLQAIPEAEHGRLDVQTLANRLRDLGLVPVGVRGLDSTVQERALQAGLGLLPAGKGERPQKTLEVSDPEPEAAPAEPASSPPARTRVITRPVRGGQQVIVEQGDVVVLAPVNPGGEVLAAGSIHVYGALRGRALAGIDGDEQARIYCLQCNPELVSVAGAYQVNESIDRAVLNRSVVISHTANGLQFDYLDLPA